MKQRQHTLKNREEKIKFLNDLTAGKIQASEVLTSSIPPATVGWIYYDKEKLYHEIGTEEKLAEVHYRAWLKKQGFGETYRIKGIDREFVITQRKTKHPDGSSKEVKILYSSMQPRLSEKERDILAEIINDNSD